MNDKEFLTNMYSSNKKDPYEYARLVGGTAEEQREYLVWLSDKIIGDPQATAHYSVEQLKSRGYVGVYRVKTK